MAIAYSRLKAAARAAKANAARTEYLQKVIKQNVRLKPDCKSEKQK